MSATQLDKWFLGTFAVWRSDETELPHLNEWEIERYTGFSL
jgi:hypothetical protein